MADTWTPLFLTDQLSNDGEEGETLLHLPNGKILQITYGLDDGSDWADVLVINNTDGTVFASALLRDVCVISGNGLAEGAYYNRQAIIGPDGFLYLYTDGAGGGFSFETPTISKINLTTLQEVDTFVTAHPEITLDDYPFFLAFEAGSVNYIAIVWESYSADTYIEVVNADTMTSVEFKTYTGVPRFAGGMIEGGLVDANTRNIYANVDYSVGAAESWILHRITFDAINGLSDLIEVTTYEPEDIRTAWVSGMFSDQLIYDPVDGTVLTFLVNSAGGESGVNGTLCKLSGTAKEVVWRVRLDRGFTSSPQFDNFNRTPLAILGANKRLFLPLNDGDGTYYFINTETGYSKDKQFASHLEFSGYNHPPAWNYATGVLAYFDELEDSTAIDPGDPSWFGGFAAYAPEWETPDVAPLDEGLDFDNTTHIRQFTIPSNTNLTTYSVPGTCGVYQSVILVGAGHLNSVSDTETVHVRGGVALGVNGSPLQAPSGYGSIAGVGFRSENNVGSTNGLSTGNTAIGLVLTNPNTSADAARAQFLQNGSTAGAFTVQHIVGEGAQFDAFALAFDNDDDQCFSNSMTPDGDSSSSHNGMDFAICVSSFSDAGFGLQTHNGLEFSIGIVTRDGTQFCLAIAEADNAAAGAPAQIVRNDAWLARQSMGAATASTSTVTLFDEDTIEYESSVGSVPSFDQFGHFFGVNLPDAANCKLFSFVTPTEVGEVAYTDPGFVPQFLFFVGSSMEEFNTSRYADARAGGFQLSTATKYDALDTGDIKQYAAGYRIKNGADPTETASAFSEHALAIPSDSSCYAVVADLVSMDENGFTLNYTSVAETGKVVFCLAIEQGNINVCEEALPGEPPPVEEGEALIGGSGMQLEPMGCVIRAQPYALEVRDINSVLELGPFRFVEQKESDETSMITTLVLGLTEVDTGLLIEIDLSTASDLTDLNQVFGATVDLDTQVDVLGDDVEIDMGEGVDNSDDFTLELLGNDDGSTYPGPPIEFKPEVLAPIDDRGSTKQYSPTGYSFLYHRVRLKATEIDEKFQVKFVDISGQLTGRLF